MCPRMIVVWADAGDVEHFPLGVILVLDYQVNCYVL